MNGYNAVTENWHDFVADEKWSRLLVRTGRRVGTSSLIRRLAKEEAERGGTVLIMCPTELQGEQHKRLLGHDKRIRVIGSHGYQMRGRSVSLALVDNAGYIAETAMSALLPCLYPHKNKECGRLGLFSFWPPNPDKSYFCQEWHSDRLWTRVVVSGNWQ